MGKSKIELICGCMFSGKTTELIRRIDALPSSATSVVIKPAIDNRYSSVDVVTHTGQKIQAQVVKHSSEILPIANGVEVIGIDELHLFDRSIVATCIALIVSKKRVICAGLDRDQSGQLFWSMQQLISIAPTNITTLFAVCKNCGKPADRSQCLVPFTSEHLIGGAESFEPRCSDCFEVK